MIGLYARAGQTEKAEKEYRATVAINPSQPQSHYDFGVLLFSAARYRDAEAAFRRALESSPNYAEAHNNLAVLLERRGKLDEAVRHYEAAIANKPSYREAHFQLGRLLLKQHHNYQAIRHFEHFIAAEGQSLIGWRDVATDTTGLGARVSESMPVIRQAILASFPGQSRLAAELRHPSQSGTDRPMRGRPLYTAAHVFSFSRVVRANRRPGTPGPFFARQPPRRA